MRRSRDSNNSNYIDTRDREIRTRRNSSGGKNENQVGKCMHFSRDWIGRNFHFSAEIKSHRICIFHARRDVKSPSFLRRREVGLLIRLFRDRGCFFPFS